jgi:hypothetical protein
LAEKIKDTVSIASYVDKHKFGDDRRDDSDLSEEEEGKYMNYTPLTKRKKMHEDDTSHVKRLNRM